MEQLKILQFEKLGKILAYHEQLQEFIPITPMDLIILTHTMENKGKELKIIDYTEKIKITKLKTSGQNYIYETLKNHNIEEIKKTYKSTSKEYIKTM